MPKKLSYMQMTWSYITFAVAALFVEGGELMFCTFLIASTIWSATHNLNKDFQAAIKKTDALHKSILRGLTHDEINK